MRSLSFLPVAHGDVTDAYRWYEEERSGLGDEFLAALDDRLDAIRDAPDGYELLKEGYRRALLGRFPYSIVFEASAARVVVYAVPHNKRDEWFWRRRLKPR